MNGEKILEILCDDRRDQRLVVAILSDASAEAHCSECRTGPCAAGSEEPCLILRQESYGADVGWFVQSRIRITPGQLRGLKLFLSSHRLTSGGGLVPPSPAASGRGFAAADDRIDRGEHVDRSSAHSCEPLAILPFAPLPVAPRTHDSPDRGHSPVERAG